MPKDEDHVSASHPKGQTTLAVSIRNPLVIFGLIFLGGGGPLLTAYLTTENQAQSWATLISLVLFVFGMGGAFCYIVIKHPRHLFAPPEIPILAMGNNLYSEPSVNRNIKQLAERAAQSEEQKIEFEAQLKSTDTYIDRLPIWLKNGETGKFVAIVEGNVICLDSDYTVVMRAFRASNANRRGIVKKIGPQLSESAEVGYYFYYQFGQLHPSDTPSIILPIGAQPPPSFNPIFVEMSLDTGASVSVIGSDTVQALGALPSNPISIQMFDGSQTFARKANVWIKLNTKFIGPFEIAVVDRLHGKAILGWDFLRIFLLEIDGPTGKVVIQSQDKQQLYPAPS